MDIDAVGRALAPVFDRPVRLGTPEPLSGRDHVVRVPLLAPDDAAAVVVKAPRAEASRQRFTLEAAALAAVGTGEAPVSARLLASSDDPPFVVMEDVHAGPSLADLLLGADRHAAAAGVVAYAEGLAEFHAWGMRRVDEFDDRVRAAGYDPQVSSLGLFAQRRRAWEDRVRRWGVDPTNAASDLDTVEQTLAEPGDLRGVVHGDPCPDNVRFVDGRLRVFDFEWASSAHVFLDGVYLSLPFPTCWCVASLPAELVAPAEAAYRSRLGIDSSRWDREATLVWAAWLVATTATLLRRVNEGDEQQWGTTTHGARIAGRLDRFARHAIAHDLVPSFTGVVRDLHERLAAQWPTADRALPSYPAFARPGERVAAAPDWWRPGA